MNDRVLGLSADADGSSVVTSKSDATPQNTPGQLARLQCREGARVYRYMKVQENIAKGQVASLFQFIDNADVDEVATTSQKVLKGTGDFTANEFGDGTFPSAFVSIDVNTGLNQTRAIVRNPGTDYLTLDKVWDTALDATSDYVTYDLNYVQQCNTGDGVPIVMGVAIADITAGQWGWFQLKGFCPLVRIVGSTDAIVAGEDLVPSATAGAAKGFTTAGTTADEAAAAFGKALHASAAADAAGRGVAALLHIDWAA